jgi:SpoVK/Ycf46/Vps4 family AAA+-type ATPase
MTDQKRLERLLCVPHPCISIVTPDEEYALGLVRDTAIQLGRGLWQWSVIGGIRNGIVSGQPPIPSTENPAAALLTLMQFEKEPAENLCVMLDLGGHLRDERTLRLLRELIAKFNRAVRQLVLIDHRDDLPPVILESVRRFEVSLPDEAELEDLAIQTLRLMNQQDRIEIDISRSGLKSIVRNLRGLTRRQAEQVIMETVSEDRRLDTGDIAAVLANKRQLLHRDGLLEYIKTPADLSEIGGLRRLRTWLRLRQNALTEKAAAFGLSPPRGILLLGVQGAGKSLCAKAIATAWQRPLLRLDPAALYDKYIGESEKKLRDALRQAEAMAPIVLWVDEIEKGFASAASRSTDGGLSQRMFGTLLTWMQEHPAPVFLVATANDIEALPPELLRKGRFDEIFFVDLPVAETRRDIFAIHLKKRNRDPLKFDLDQLAAASEGFSGAEIEQAVIAALHEAFAASKELETAYILKALRESPPLSVTMAEKVEALRLWAQGRCVPAD